MQCIPAATGVQEALGRPLRPQRLLYMDPGKVSGSQFRRPGLQGAGGRMAVAAAAAPGASAQSKGFTSADAAVLAKVICNRRSVFPRDFTGAPLDRCLPSIMCMISACAIVGSNRALPLYPQKEEGFASVLCSGLQRTGMLGQCVEVQPGVLKRGAPSRWTLSFCALATCRAIVEDMLEAARWAPTHGAPLPCRVYAHGR